MDSLKKGRIVSIIFAGLTILILLLSPAYRSDWNGGFLLYLIAYAIIASLFFIYVYIGGSTGGMVKGIIFNIIGIIFFGFLYNQYAEDLAYYAEDLAYEISVGDIYYIKHYNNFTVSCRMHIFACISCIIAIFLARNYSTGDVSGKDSSKWHIVQDVVPGEKCPICGNKITEAWDPFHKYYKYCSGSGKCGWRSH